MPAVAEAGFPDPINGGLGLGKEWGFSGRHLIVVRFSDLTRNGHRPASHVAMPIARTNRGGQTGSLSDRKRLIEIGEDVVDMLDADRQPNVAFRDAGLRLLLGRELRCVVVAG